MLLVAFTLSIDGVSTSDTNSDSGTESVGVSVATQRIRAIALLAILFGNTPSIDFHPAYGGKPPHMAMVIAPVFMVIDYV